MASIQEISTYFFNCPISKTNGCASGTGLTAIHKCIPNRGKSTAKADMVYDIAEFYADKRNIQAVWAGLSECERDFISYIVWNEGEEFIPTTVEYAQKYNLRLEAEIRWGRKESILDSYYAMYLKFLHILKENFPKTKTVMFFPNGMEMPAFVLEALKPVIPPMRFDYSEYAPTGKDYVIRRENKTGDFGAVVRFAASERLKVKAGTLDLTKAKLAKLADDIKLEEVCDNGGIFGTAKDTERISDFKVALPLFALAANSGLVGINRDGTVYPGPNSPELLAMPRKDLVKKLLNDYLSENRISEARYIAFISVDGGDWFVKWQECRKTIVELLKTCPPEKFVKYEEFDNYARIYKGNFVRRLLPGSVTVKGDEFDMYRYVSRNYKLDWDEFEAQVIRLILSFLSAMGIIDVAYTEGTPRIKYSKDDFCVGIAGFRITKLGAWALGMVKTYEEPEFAAVRSDEGGLYVLPDYAVMITGLKYRINHETYLSQFLTKVSTDGDAAVYKLDFQSIVRAFNKGITPETLKAYLTKECSVPLPDNVVRSLADWQAKVGKVRVGSYTVLETDDPMLLEELKHIKGMDKIIICDLNCAAAIDGNQIKKMKSLIEKNGWLVKA